MRVRYHGSHVLTIENSQKCAYSVYLLIKGSERSCKTPTKLHSAHFGKCMPPPASLCPTFPFHSCLESVWASGTPRWRQESSDLQKSLLEGTVGILLANPFFLFLFLTDEEIAKGKWECFTQGDRGSQWQNWDLNHSLKSRTWAPIRYDSLQRPEVQAKCLCEVGPSFSGCGVVNVSTRTWSWTLRFSTINTPWCLASVLLLQHSEG